MPPTKVRKTRHRTTPLFIIGATKKTETMTASQRRTVKHAGSMAVRLPSRSGILLTSTSRALSTLLPTSRVGVLKVAGGHSLTLYLSRAKSATAFGLRDREPTHSIPFWAALPMPRVFDYQCYRPQTPEHDSIGHAPLAMYFNYFSECVRYSPIQFTGTWFDQLHRAAVYQSFHRQGVIGGMLHCGS